MGAEGRAHHLVVHCRRLAPHQLHRSTRACPGLLHAPGEYPWQTYDVTDDMGGTLQAGALGSWWSPGDNSQHIAAFFPYQATDPTSYLLAELWVVPDEPPWKIKMQSIELDTIFAQPGALTTFYSSTDDLYHIGFIGDNFPPFSLHRGHIIDFVRYGYDATNDAGLDLAQPGALTSWWSAIDTRQHMAYIDARGHIQDISAVPEQPPWALYDATEDAGAPAARAGGALTSWWSQSDNTQHIAYIDNNGSVQELWVVPGERHGQPTRRTDSDHGVR